MGILSRGRESGQSWVVYGIALIVLVVFACAAFGMGSLVGPAGLQKLGLAPADTPPATATSTPTDTPTATLTATPADTPTATPPPTQPPTPTPNWTATREAEGSAIVAAVAAALTALPTSPLTEPPTAAPAPDTEATAAAQEVRVLALVASALTAQPAPPSTETLRTAGVPDAQATAREERLRELVAMALTSQPSPTPPPLLAGTFRSDAWGMSMSYPAGWMYLDFTDLTSLDLPDPGDALLIGMFQGTIKSFDDMALFGVVRSADFAGQDVKSIQKEMAKDPTLSGKLNIKELQPRLIGGIPVEGCSYRIEMPDELPILMGKAFHQGEFYLFTRQEDGLGYIIFTSSLGDGRDRHGPTFEAMLDSIAW